jgi:hypothetical protein
MTKPFRIISKPGIRRDGTVLEGSHYIDGKWVRFQRGLPRKIGGYRQLSPSFSGPIREINVDASNGQTYFHTFWSGGIERMTLDNITGVATTVIDRSPAGFVADAANDWTTATMYNSLGSSSVVVAHVAPNLGQIDNEVGGLIYYGDAKSTSGFTQVTDPDIVGSNALAGGIVVLHPFLVVFGQSGAVCWSDANDPTKGYTNKSRVTQSKIVAGKVLRGGVGASPSGLLWSTDSLLRMYYTGGATEFSFDTISDAISIMSPNAVVEFEGIYYWVGIDKFYMFNGVVREMPNSMNLNWFFDNLNYAQRSKVFAVSVPRWGEIWFCYPRGTATECTHAVIFNTRESALAGYPVWYDTELPLAGRTMGVSASVFPYPVMASATPISGKYEVFQHEYGRDAVEGLPPYTNAIDSFFETNEISAVNGGFGDPRSKWLRVETIEPDFVQSGDMTVQITGRTNARAGENDGDAIVFPETPVSQPYQQIVPAKEARRLLRFKFRSNVQGGHYEMGNCIAHVADADGTVIG